MAIVYNLNKEELLYCIQSIVQQSVHDYEVIIVDDGSTDNSKEIFDLCFNKNGI